MCSIMLRKSDYTFCISHAYVGLPGVFLLPTELIENLQIVVESYRVDRGKLRK